MARAKRTTRGRGSPKRKPAPRKPPPLDDALGDGGLTLRQAAFVAAMAGPAGLNATKAARMAGYAAASADVEGPRLLGNARVQDALARALARRNLTPEWAKETLQDLAGASMANFLDLDEKGVPTLSFKRAAEMGALGQVKEYTETPTEAGVVRKIRLHDRLAAVMGLLKLYGLMLERHAGADGGPVQVSVKPREAIDYGQLIADLEQTIRDNAARRVQPDGP